MNYRPDIVLMDDPFWRYGAIAREAIDNRRWSTSSRPTNLMEIPARSFQLTVKLCTVHRKQHSMVLTVTPDDNSDPLIGLVETRQSPLSLTWEVPPSGV